jgi:hypothetical protein
VVEHLLVAMVLAVLEMIRRYLVHAYSLINFLHFANDAYLIPDLRNKERLELSNSQQNIGINVLPVALVVDS